MKEREREERKKKSYFNFNGYYNFCFFYAVV